MKILLTGFMPFGGDSINPSWEAVKRLPDRIDNEEIVRLCLPVSYARVRDILRNALMTEKPDAVICVGQAGGRAMLTPEMVAINLQEATLPDQDGILLSGEAVLSDGPAAYFTTLPVKRMIQRMREAGIPAVISYTAGTYVCNSTMYHLMDMLAKEFPAIRGGFIHIPFMCEQVLEKPASTPSLPLDTMISGLIAAVKAVAEEDKRRSDT